MVFQRSMAASYPVSRTVLIKVFVLVLVGSNFTIRRFFVAPSWRLRTPSTLLRAFLILREHPAQCIVSPARAPYFRG